MSKPVPRGHEHPRPRLRSLLERFAPLPVPNGLGAYVCLCVMCFLQEYLNAIHHLYEEWLIKGALFPVAAPVLVSTSGRAEDFSKEE